MNKKYLDKTRMPENNIKIATKVQYSLFAFVLGIILGIFSKWLDNMPIDDTIWWQYIFNVIQLNSD